MALFPFFIFKGKYMSEEYNRKKFQKASAKGKNGL